jgi:hypothetical protein
VEHRFSSALPDETAVSIPTGACRQGQSTFVPFKNGSESVQPRAASGSAAVLEDNFDEHIPDYTFYDNNIASELESETLVTPVARPATTNTGFHRSKLFNGEENSSKLNPLDFIKPSNKLPTGYGSEEEIFEAEEIRSRPKEGGNWNPMEPLKWTENFGRRSPEYEKRLETLIRLKPGDEGYYDVSDIEVPGCAIVRTKEQARIVLERLNNADPSIFHACDTEVMDIDVKLVGPVGNGYVICCSIFSGPDFDYGLGQGPGAKLFIDNLDDSCGLLQEFKEWFENERFLKVWHNYGFDRHVMWNEGINAKGFGGDTMHMARLQNTSRMISGGYSLENLTAELLQRRKQPMKELFGIHRKRKDGSDGLVLDVPPVEELQRNPKHRVKWIKYSCYDAEGTWLIREKLDEELGKMPWFRDHYLNEYYYRHMRPFGEVLTDLERRGIRVDAKDYLAKVEKQAREDRAYHVNTFKQWAYHQIGADGLALNTGSAPQLSTFLFGGAENKKTNEKIPEIRTFKIPREEIPEDALEAYRIRDEEIAAEKAKGEGKYPGRMDSCFYSYVLTDSMT